LGLYVNFTSECTDFRKFPQDNRVILNLSSTEILGGGLYSVFMRSATLAMHIKSNRFQMLIYLALSSLVASLVAACGGPSQQECAQRKADGNPSNDCSSNGSGGGSSYSGTTGGRAGGSKATGSSSSGRSGFGSFGGGRGGGS
jgi:hypothetical protein